MGSRDRRGARTGEQPSRAGRSLPSARARRRTGTRPSRYAGPRRRVPDDPRDPGPRPAADHPPARAPARRPHDDPRPRRRPGPRGPVAGCHGPDPRRRRIPSWRPTARSGRPRRAGTRSSTTFCRPPWPSRRSASDCGAAATRAVGGSSWIARARAIDSGVRRRSVGTGCASADIGGVRRRPPRRLQAPR